MACRNKKPPDPPPFLKEASSHILVGEFPILSPKSPLKSNNQHSSPQTNFKTSYADLLKGNRISNSFVADSAGVPLPVFDLNLISQHQVKGQRSRSESDSIPIIGDSICLNPVSIFEGKPSVLFPSSTKSLLIEKLKFVLVGKFTHGRPTLQSIKAFFMKLKLKGDCNVSSFDKKHIFIECLCKEDYYHIWLHLNWIIDGFAMRVFKWSPDFSPLRECSIVPVWIRLQGLPLYLFDTYSLFSIANSVGHPIKVDARNVNRSMLNSARICVELDINKPLVEDVRISFVDESSKAIVDGFWVKVFYDVLPSFCSYCLHIGHDSLICKRKDSEIDVAQDKMPTRLVQHPIDGNNTTARSSTFDVAHGNVLIKTVQNRLQNDLNQADPVDVEKCVMVTGLEVQDHSVKFAAGFIDVQQIEIQNETGRFVGCQEGSSVLELQQQKMKELGCDEIRLQQNVLQVGCNIAKDPGKGAAGANGFAETSGVAKEPAARESTAAAGPSAAGYDLIARAAGAVLAVGAVGVAGTRGTAVADGESAAETADETVTDGAATKGMMQREGLLVNSLVQEAIPGAISECLEEETTGARPVSESTQSSLRRLERADGQGYFCSRNSEQKDAALDNNLQVECGCGKCEDQLEQERRPAAVAANQHPDAGGSHHTTDGSCGDAKGERDNHTGAAVHYKAAPICISLQSSPMASVSSVAAASEQVALVSAGFQDPAGENDAGERFDSAKANATAQEVHEVGAVLMCSVLDSDMEGQKYDMGQHSVVEGAEAVAAISKTTPANNTSTGQKSVAATAEAAAARPKTTPTPSPKHAAGTGYQGAGESVNADPKLVTDKLVTDHTIVLGLPAQTRTSPNSWAVLVEEEQEQRVTRIVDFVTPLKQRDPAAKVENEVRIISPSSLSDIEVLAQQEMEKIWTTTNTDAQISNTSPFNPYILDKVGSPVPCSEVIRKSPRLSKVRDYVDSVKNGNSIPALKDKEATMKDKKLYNTLRHKYNEEIRLTFEEHQQNIYATDYTTQKATTQNQEVIPDDAAVDKKEWTTVIRRSQRLNHKQGK